MHYPLEYQPQHTLSQCPLFLMVCRKENKYTVGIDFIVLALNGVSLF